MPKSQEEFQQAYSQLALQIGDRINKVRLLNREVENLHKAVDNLDEQYQAFKAEQEAEAKKKAEDEAVESALKMGAAEEKRAKKASKLKVVGQQ